MENPVVGTFTIGQGGPRREFVSRKRSNVTHVPPHLASNAKCTQFYNIMNKSTILCTRFLFFIMFKRTSVVVINPIQVTLTNERKVRKEQYNNPGRAVPPRDRKRENSEI